MSETKYSIPLSSPDITEREIEAVVEVLKSGTLSLGPRLPEFEKALSGYAGTKYGIAVNSGTSGLHLCVRALGLKPGDEVITSSFSFIASSNCVIFEGAKPVFVDIDPVSLNFDIDKIEAAITPRTKAIIAVHAFGMPVDMPRVMEIARRHNLAVIEDACEAIGARIKDPATGEWKMAGTFGDCALYAFYPNKQITTGEGGMIITDNDEIARLCISMRNQGRDSGMGWLAHARLGYNYRLSDMSCALGAVQVSRLPEILNMRKEVAARYTALFGNKYPEIGLPCPDPDNLGRSWFVYVIKLPKGYTGDQRNELIVHLRGLGIGCNQYFSPIHLQPFYQKEYGWKRGDLPETEYAGDHCMSIPFFNRLTEESQKVVVNEIKAWLDANPPRN